MPGQGNVNARCFPKELCVQDQVHGRRSKGSGVVMSGVCWFGQSLHHKVTLCHSRSAEYIEDLMVFLPYATVSTFLHIFTYIYMVAPASVWLHLIVPGQNWLRAAGPKMAAANGGNDSEVLQRSDNLRKNPERLGWKYNGCREVLGTQKILKPSHFAKG